LSLNKNPIIGAVSIKEMDITLKLLQRFKKAIMHFRQIERDLQTNHNSGIGKYIFENEF